MTVEIRHLFECPKHLQEVARLIHEEWWSDKPGHSVSTMAARLAQATSRNSIPLSLVALQDGQPVGTVNLVENDNDERQDLTPWLAALLVTPEVRGHGVGTMLVRALLRDAAALGISRLYLGTDIPGYYARLGASLFAEYADGYRIMTFDPLLASPAPTLDGQGLTLRRILPEQDASPLHAVLGDESQLRYMLRQPCASVAETRALLQTWNDEVSSPQWALLDEASVVGRISLVKQREGVFEVGVQVVPQAQGRGFATRAILVATLYAFESLGACRVFADIDPDNSPCVRAFRSAGFSFEGTLVSNWRTPHGTFDSAIYAATSEWSKVHRRR